MKRVKARGFTLVELLIVIGIIGVLMSILLPALGRARESASTIKCLSNLRQLGAATVMYSNDAKGFLPYPTGAYGDVFGVPNAGDRMVWFAVLDEYIAGIGGQGRTDNTVAANRAYTPYKQCVVYEEFEGGRGTGNQDNLKEYARSYKMNTHLRRNTPRAPAKVTDVQDPTEFVYMGDGVSLDLTGPIPSQWDSGQFSFEVNDKKEANPALRHNRDAANILFVDGHAATITTKTIKKKLQFNADIEVKSWESEYVNASGTPVNLPDKTKTAEEQGLRRNPQMPLVWSQPPRLHR